MEKASTRLRKTFRYPTDDQDDLPSALDEQEQETLIQTLQTENEQTNARYKLYFLAIPIISTIPYIPLLLTAQKLIALLSITSLICSAYLFYTLPHGTTGIILVDKRNASVSRIQRREPGYNPQARGPVLRWLPVLNIALGWLVLLLGLITRAKSDVAGQGHIKILSYLPLGIYLFTLVAKIVMGSVDVEELTELKYNYKGA